MPYRVLLSNKSKKSKFLNTYPFYSHVSILHHSGWALICITFRILDTYAGVDVGVLPTHSRARYLSKNCSSDFSVTALSASAKQDIEVCSFIGWPFEVADLCWSAIVQWKSSKLMYCEISSQFRKFQRIDFFLLVCNVLLPHGLWDNIVYLNNSINKITHCPFNTADCIWSPWLKLNR